MKKKTLNPKVGKILLAIGCLLLAVVFWFAVKYGEMGSQPVSLFVLG